MTPPCACWRKACSTPACSTRDKVGSLDDVIAKGAYRQFYMHRTGHWLGMDVHDVGEYRDAAPTASRRARCSRAWC